MRAEAQHAQSKTELKQKYGLFIFYKRVIYLPLDAVCVFTYLRVVNSCCTISSTLQGVTSRARHPLQYGTQLFNGKGRKGVSSPNFISSRYGVSEFHAVFKFSVNIEVFCVVQ